MTLSLPRWLAPLVMVVVLLGLGHPGLALLVVVGWVALRSGRLRSLLRRKWLQRQGLSPQAADAAVRLRRMWPGVVENACLLVRRQGGSIVSARLGDVRDGVRGPVFEVHLPAGMDPASVDAAQLSSALGVPLTLAALGPRTIEVQVNWVDPLAEVLQRADGTSPGAEAVSIGVDAAGSEVRLRLLGQHVLVGGVPEAGKSGVLTAAISEAARCPEIALLGIDLKLVELAPWRQRFSAVATEADTAEQLLRGLIAEMGRRYAWLEATGRKKVTMADLSPALPLLVLVVDELAELTAAGIDKKGEAERAALLRRLAALGRAAGVVLIVATQKPSSDVIPTSLRDVLPVRISMKTTNRDMTATIVGAGLETTAPAHEIPVGMPGVGWLVGESVAPRQFRAFWVPDDEVAERVRAVASLRVDLPWLDEVTAA